MQGFIKLLVVIALSLLAILIPTTRILILGIIIGALAITGLFYYNGSTIKWKR